MGEESFNREIVNELARMADKEKTQIIEEVHGPKSRKPSVWRKVLFWAGLSTATIGGAIGGYKVSDLIVRAVNQTKATEVASQANCKKVVEENSSTGSKTVIVPSSILTEQERKDCGVSFILNMPRTSLDGKILNANIQLPSVNRIDEVSRDTIDSMNNHNNVDMYLWSGLGGMVGLFASYVGYTEVRRNKREDMADQRFQAVVQAYEAQHPRLDLEF